MKILKIGVGTVVAAISALTLGMFCSAHRNTLKIHRMKTSLSTASNAKLKVFFISDIHRRRVPDRLLEKVRSQVASIDLVIIGGDVAEKGVPVNRVKHNIEKLSTLGPIYYVWGNNDREIGEDTIRNLISSVGGTILDNESIRIASHPEWIITGADDPSSGNTNVQKAVAFDGEYTYQLVAVHNPSLFKKFVEVSDPSLLVGGHTHGGQIRCGPYGMQLRGTFKETASRAELISNGYGTTLVPFRFGAPSETHLLIISYEKRRENSQHAKN
ncbi:metallophosphoesterase [Sporosarcina sp. A2]|uniref:metallophosphoesterase n=1 Tax=Sporosarcina sp. A2 TaxID=3393449 RepID=UPI003D78F0AA